MSRSKVSSENPSGFKEKAHRLIDSLPAEAGWNELCAQLALMAEIDRGIADIKAGRVYSTEELRREFGLPESD